MRGKHLLIGLAALAWVGVWPGAAQAWSSGSASTFCTSGLNACVSVMMQVTGSERDPWLELTVTNVGNEGVITNVGLFNLPRFTVRQYQLWTLEGSLVSNWSFHDSAEVGGYEGLSHLMAPSNPGGILPGQALRFVFRLRSTWNIDDTNVAWAFQTHDGTVWASNLATTGGPEPGDTDGGSSNPSPPEASVPEPGTMVLLGTGLVGILGMAGLRRRRNGVHGRDS